MTGTFIAYVICISSGDPRLWVYKVHRVTGRPEPMRHGISLPRDNGVAWFTSDNPIVVTADWREDPTTQVITDMP